jgi:hypothetical protein
MSDVQSVSGAARGNGSFRATARPPPGAYFEVAGISADAPNDAWIVGRIDDTGVAYHWNGSVWSSVALPNSRILRGVSAVAPDDVWVVSQKVRTVWQHIEHWNGTAWRVVREVPPPGAWVGIAAFSHSNVFLLGDRGLSTLGEN